MDSINSHQPEKNREDLHGESAIKKVKELVHKAPNCFFCTGGGAGEFSTARPMNVRKVDDEGTLWFLSAIDSHKNLELQRESEVTLFFQGSTHSDFLELRGQATVSQDRAKIKELWEPAIQTWFTEGIDDPRISVIKVVPTGGYYWDTKHGNFVAGIKIVVGAMLRKTLDDSIEGTLQIN